MASSPQSPVIVWFRQDLRLADNPALHAAASSGAPVVPLFVLDNDAAGSWAPGGAGRWWLHHSLARLGEALARLGSPLVLRRGPAGTVLRQLIQATGADRVVWNRAYEPWAVARDSAIKADLRGQSITAESFNATLLAEPWTLRTRSGEPFKVFSPFWRALLAAPEPPPPLPAPAALRPPASPPASDCLDDWDLLPRPDWTGGLRATWTPGEDGAKTRLDSFLADGLAHYRDGRDFPAHDQTSRLSPHLHWGEIGPRQVWHAAFPLPGSEPFLRELGWREFSYSLLYHQPDLPSEPLDRRFAAFPWQADDAALEAWQRGRTGYPIVDAGMRQLWRIGWMHNRVRMIAGSFLVKDLMLPWQAGQAWFRDTLVDADLANNAAGWQWIAGCGADAAPFFRVFNPVLQGEKFDPDGVYVRRFVPELAKLPAPYIHRPWTAPADVLAAAGVELGRTYPKPIVDHGQARTRALAAFEALRGRDRDLAQEPVSQPGRRSARS